MYRDITQEKALKHIKYVLGVSKTSMRVYEIILDEADSQNTYYTTYFDLSNRIECKSYSTISRIIKELSRVGLVIKHSIPGKPTMLEITHPAMRKERVSLHLDITNSLQQQENIQHPLPQTVTNSNINKRIVIKRQESPLSRKPLLPKAPEPLEVQHIFSSAVDYHGILVSREGVVSYAH